MSTTIGSRITRLEDEPLLRGRGRFVDDIVLAGVWHAAFVRSPHPHALIKSVDKTAALAVPGVHAVLTLDDLAKVMVQRRMIRHSNSGMPLDKAWPFALADGEVCYVGEPVAMVVADDRYIAEDAAAQVAVDYEALAVRRRRADREGFRADPPRALQQCHHHLQGGVRRRRCGVRQGRACVQAGAVAAPRRGAFDRGARACSPSCARPTAASRCTPRPRRRTICSRR